MFSKNSILVAIALAGVMASGSASAEFIQSDVYVAGDNKAVLDTDTGLEWMKLSETANRTVGSYMNLDNGWRLATPAEVTQYLYNLFDVDESDFTDTANENRLKIDVQSENLNADAAETLGWTWTHNNSPWKYAQGYVLDQDTGDIAMYGIQYSSYAQSSAPTYLRVGEELQNATVGGSRSSFASNFLVSTGGATYSSINDEEFKTIQAAAAVPLPLMGLGALGLLGLGFSRKKKVA